MKGEIVMNILSMKRQQYLTELANAKSARDAEIAEKVAAYKASLEAQSNEKITTLKSAISAIDVLLDTKSHDFEYEIVEDEVSDAEIEEELDIEEAELESDTQDNSSCDLADCFKKKTLLNQRPGMSTISVPARH